MKKYVNWTYRGEILNPVIIILCIYNFDIAELYLYLWKDRNYWI